MGIIIVLTLSVASTMPTYSMINFIRLCEIRSVRQFPALLQQALMEGAAP